MAKNYNRYPMRFRERAVERMKLGENVSQLARELGNSLGPEIYSLKNRPAIRAVRILAESRL
jgi:hypothetical protein